MENVSTRATSLVLLVLMTETCSFASRTLMRGYLMLRKISTESRLHRFENSQRQHHCQGKFIFF
ncbi:hypothetical protein NC651_005604 [Populus alba x Populus x berolinensis]|nr:hypothetical protein NC651_005604 [Populus alba x Populus x berolinensis]